MKISEVFSQSKKENRKIFIPYITAGDPSLADTERFLHILQENGADIIELGIPFSDPVADGPTIQRASERALAGGANVRKILDLVAKMRSSKTLSVPVVLFTYMNPILKVSSFFEEAARAGVDGLLIVDLPPEEAGDVLSGASKNGLETIFLASPTTTEERLRLVEKCSSAFVYYVSRLGVTGVQNKVSETLDEEIERVKKIIKKPLAIGFGVSTPEQARAVAQFGDGVVVGSAIVEAIEKKENLGEFVLSLSRAVNIYRHN